MDNCDIWGSVDFGRGPVDVRCTREGPHSRHVCSVIIEVTENVPVDELIKDFEHKNIFDSDEAT